MGNMKLSDSSPKKEMPVAGLRKINKPLMEKRRRARINNCLSQLKVLVLDAMKRDTTQISKLEKADILEMTVRYLRNVQNAQIQNGASTSSPSDYKIGFRDCASEVMRYVGTMQNIGNDVKSRLWDHLNYCSIKSSTKAQTCVGNIQQSYDEPLKVQIPKCSSVPFQKHNRAISINGFLLQPVSNIHNLKHITSCSRTATTSTTVPNFSETRCSSVGVSQTLAPLSQLNVRNNNAVYKCSVTNDIENNNNITVKNSNSPSSEPVWRPW